MSTEFTENSANKIRCQSCSKYKDSMYLTPCIHNTNGLNLCETCVVKPNGVILQYKCFECLGNYPDSK